jgi:hypothetical protein
MVEITSGELYAFFIDTLEKCNSGIYMKDDEIVEYEVLEDFDISVGTFLFNENLMRLLVEGFINDEIFKLSSDLRKRVLSIPREKWKIESIRNGGEWSQVSKKSDQILQLIKHRNGGETP